MKLEGSKAKLLQSEGESLSWAGSVEIYSPLSLFPMLPFTGLRLTTLCCLRSWR